MSSSGVDEEQEHGVTDPLRRRRSTVAASIISICFGDLEELKKIYHQCLFEDDMIMLCS
jgi:hypothetical protein